MTKDQIVQQTKRAIYEVFGDIVDKDIIDKSVVHPLDDPGEWAPRSNAVIYHETGLPNSCDSWDGMEKWSEVSDKIPGDYYVEAMNSAVSAVYEI